MARLDWHVDARADLRAISEFISRESPSFAPLFTRRIFETVRHLRAHPQMGRVVPEVDDPTCREVIFQNYRIVYRVKGDSIVIVGVIHAAMDLSRQAENRG